MFHLPAKKLVKVLSTFVVLLAAYYFVLTAPTYWTKLAFIINPPKLPVYKNISDVLPIQSPVNISTPTKNTTPLLKPISPNANISLPTNPIQVPADLEHNQLQIPDLGIKAPINYQVKVDTPTLLKSLQTGVVNFEGTAIPPNSGNVFISGHSSYFWWDKGSYKRVFANLPSIKVDQKIYIDYQGKPYIYQVKDTKTVSPSQTDVMNETSSPTLTLMTCVPVGTSAKRLIVTAKRIYPVESEVTETKSTTPQLKKLPSIL